MTAADGARMCSRCLYDSTIPGITFGGTCNGRPQRPRPVPDIARLQAARPISEMTGFLGFD